MTVVLVVEDSPTQAAQVRLMLEERGYQVREAANGRAALEEIGRAAPDLVLTDLDMPELNGLELVEAVRAKHPMVPVILMTAFGSEQLAAEALRRGAASYVPKRDLERDLAETVGQVAAGVEAARRDRRLFECLARAEHYFVLDNDLALVPPLVGHLTEYVRRLKLCDGNALVRLTVAWSEALTNAITHGNLEVSSELRQQDDGRYEALLRERRGQAPYRDRRVHVTARESAGEAVYVIRDEGPGFDPSQLPDPTDPANLERIGGRGLLLIRTFMDEVSHNARGNEITLVKRRCGR